MNSERQLVHELERLGGTMASGPSLVAGVMDRVDELPPPVRPSARAPKLVLAVGVALAACVLVALSAWFANNDDSSSNVAASNASGGKTSVQEPTEPMEPDSLPLGVDPSGPDAAPGAPVEASASGGRTFGVCLRRIRLSEQLSGASAVVRARMVATEDNNHIIVYRITKLIYGRFPGKTLRQWDHFAGGEGATNFEEGKEVTLFVGRIQRKDATVICGIHFGALDEHDKRILEIVKSGTHLLPGKGPHDLVSYIRSSQRVVRAKLVKLDDVGSHWDVSETVCSSSKSSSGRPVWRVVPRNAITSTGEKEDPRITLSMTPWRLRAEAIVRAQAAQQAYTPPQQTDPKQTEKQIQEEFNRLVSTDLKIGRDAILFIRPNDDPTEKARYWPAFVFPADPDNRGYLDQLAKKVRGIIERGEHEVINL